MQSVDEINAQIAVHRDNIEQLKEQIDLLGVSDGEGPADNLSVLEAEILEEWGHIRELETERDELPALPIF